MNSPRMKTRLQCVILWMVQLEIFFLLVEIFLSFFRNKKNTEGHPCCTSVLNLPFILQTESNHPIRFLEQQNFEDKLKTTVGIKLNLEGRGIRHLKLTTYFLMSSSLRHPEMFLFWLKDNITKYISYYIFLTGRVFPI